MQQPSVTINQPIRAEDLLGISVQVYPNPVSEQLKVSSTAMGQIIYALTSNSGTKVATGIFAGEIMLDVSYLPPGLYALTLTQGTLTESIEIIKH